jgi:hypothetical protein
MAPIPLLSTLHHLTSRQLTDPSLNGNPANGHPEYSSDPMVNPTIPLPMICLVISVVLIAAVAAIVNGSRRNDEANRERR